MSDDLQSASRRKYDAERPSALYKYCPPERADILENLKIRFTQPAAFNDIFESLPGSDIEPDFERAHQSFISKMARTFMENPEWNRKQRREYERNELRNFERWLKRESKKGWHQRLCEEVQLLVSGMTGVLCLSDKWDNILMWSHYASEHRGFVIQFSGSDPFFDQGLQKVRYSEERPLLGNRPDGWNSGDLFVTKSTDWEYEQEFRKTESFGKRSQLPNGNTFVEFPRIEDIDPTNWPLYLIDVPPTAIVKVFFGWRAAEGTKLRIARALRTSKLRHVTTAEVHPHRTSFRMQVSAT